MTPRPFSAAMSCARTCFLMLTGSSEPPFTVASFAMNIHGTPWITPMPVTMPAPGALLSYSSHPASVDSSTNGVSASHTRSMRSRGRILPRL